MAGTDEQNAVDEQAAFPTAGEVGRYGWRQRSGLFIGLAVFGLLLALPPPEGLSPAGMRVAAVAVLMAVWWITEAIPIPATSLLPLLLFPLLDAGAIRETAAPYANPLIFLFLGGFMMALAMQRWGLHRRIALHIIRRVGTRPSSLIAGFMISAAFLSMWVSNTATAMMMLPIGLSVIELAREDTALPGDYTPSLWPCFWPSPTRAASAAWAR